MEHRRISVGPRDVLRLKKPTNGFLCNLSENSNIVEFQKFSIRNDDTKELFFGIDGEGGPIVGQMDIDYGVEGDDCFRAIKYTFSEDVLRTPVISTSLQFKVGSQPLQNFRMIERHYFRKRLIKSYDWTFGFCIPSSTNNWEAIYDVPPLDQETIEDMIANPYETVSDSFYFVGNELVMHNKARYRYVKKGESDDDASVNSLMESLALMDEFTLTEAQPTSAEDNC